MRKEKMSAIDKISGANNYIKTSAQEEAFKYMCGAAVHAYLRQHGECHDCESQLCDEAPIRSFVQMRKYDVASDLKYPSSHCMRHLELVDNVLHRHLVHHAHKENISKTLFRLVQQEVPSKLPSCELHKLICEDYIVKKWIKMSIKIYCKDFLQNKINKRRIARKRKKLLKGNIPNKRERLF